ncbi:MAG TPA: glucosamine-6-phosphate synthase, partial [Planctomycetota bacterium]|nr:glucosamine-6-phosphate synthase [Planctomycetota bacterium]
FTAAAATVYVPAVHPSLAFLLSTMAGHLFGYRAALALDALALPLRRARGAIEAVVGDPALRVDALVNLRSRLPAPAQQFRQDLLAGRYDGALEARTASRLTSLLNLALGIVPLEAHAAEFGTAGSPGLVIDELTAELTRAIDQLTRPVDAIKHQAKTVTVGISRADEALLTVPLVRAVLQAGALRDRLGYRDLRALAGLDPAVLEVLGSTRYRIDGDADGGTATIHVLDQRGLAAGLPSRTASNPTLKGTKHTVAMEKACLVARGRNDDRTVVLVPEVEQNRAVGLTLLHVRFAEHLPTSALRGVLGGYRNRFAALQDAVTETEPEFDTAVLERMRVVDLLTEPVFSLADRWRRSSGQR